MRDLRRFVATRPYVFAAALAIGFAAATIIVQPSFAHVSNWRANIANFAPLVLLAMASTPAVLGGGLDVSLGPLAGLISILMARELLGGPLGAPEICIPIVLAMGCAVGTLSGISVAVFRYPPIIATLCGFFIMIGLSQQLAVLTAVPANWTTDIAGSILGVPGGLFLIVPCGALWVCLRRTAFVRTLMAVGGGAEAAYSAGARVTTVRICAYALGGLLAGAAGIAIMAIVQTGDPLIGQSYTLIAVAAVVIGGTQLGGGRGGMLGSVVGAAAIFLLENFLSALQVPVLWTQVVYGGLLLAGLLAGGAVAGGETVSTGS